MISLLFIGAPIYIAVGAVLSRQVKVTKKNIFPKPGQGAMAAGVFRDNCKQVMLLKLNPEATLSPPSGRMNNL